MDKEGIKYIDKIYKFITKENREIIGNLKAFNKDGNFYLIDCVEVLNKKSDNFTKNDLFENNEDHQFYYETENYQYQYLNNCIFPSEEIGDILMLKDDIYNKYKIMLDKKDKEEEKEEEKEKEENKEEEKELENNLKKELENKLKKDLEKKMDDLYNIFKLIKDENVQRELQKVFEKK